MNEEKRNLLYVELTYNYIEDDKYFSVEKMKEIVYMQAECIHKAYLHSFREHPDKPYFIWVGSGHLSEFPLAYVSFKIRLKSPYDTDFVIPAFRDLPHVTKIETSWFPSRSNYGGIVQKDGTVIENWDI